MSKISNLISDYERRYHNSFNLVASENCSSPAVRAALSSDLHHRYAIPPENERPPGLWDYPHQDEIRNIIKETEALACRLFQGKQANLFPLSGNQIAQIMIMNLLQPGETFLSVGASCGGHFTTAKVAERHGVRRIDLPYDFDTGSLNVELTAELAAKEKPKMVFLDASMILFPYPVKELRSALDKDVIISYDASHTFGLIGGGRFQSPLSEGADFLHGSTHKSLWGPQKGMIIAGTSPETTDKAFKDILPFFVSNVHMHHIAALGIALEEVEKHGAAYASVVVDNARALAAEMHRLGADVLFADQGFTDCHQIIVRIGEKQKAMQVFESLQKAGLNTNAMKMPFSKESECYGLRIGAAEVTRRGLKGEAMLLLARLIADTIHKKQPIERIASAVSNLSQQYMDIQYV